MGQFKVLMVDDNRDEFLIIARLLARGGDFSLDFEANIDEALMKMCRNLYDIYLLDYQLGSINGIELLTKARKSGCRNAVIMLTGYEIPDVDLKAIKSGADDYLQKDEVNDQSLARTLRYAYERRAAEQSLTEQQLQLYRAQKMSAIGEMASAIIHEINNPLAIISGRVSFLQGQLNRQQYDEAKFSETLGIIKKTTVRISKVIKGLRIFSRDASRDPMAEIPVEKIIDDAIEVCQPKIKYSLTEIKKEPMPQDLSLECRPVEISQILINLINNAIDAIEEKPERWVKIAAVEESGVVKITVTDSGEGIPVELQEKIIKGFFTTKSEGKGTGLGLNISNLIARRYGGGLSLNSQCQNTQFVVELPCKYGSLPRPHILVVDDEFAIQEMIKDCLAVTDAVFFNAVNGQTALEIMLQNKIDLVLCDYRLPDMDGLSLLQKRLEAATGEIPRFLLITAYNEGITFENHPEVVGLVSKPFDAKVLLARVQDALKEQRLAYQ